MLGAHGKRHAAARAVSGALWCGLESLHLRGVDSSAGATVRVEALAPLPRDVQFPKGFLPATECPLVKVSVALIAVFALGFHTLVWLAGSLYLAMAARVAYDSRRASLMGGWAENWIHRRLRGAEIVTAE
jgi:hypothetical protein